MMKHNAIITTSQRVQKRINSVYLIYFLTGQVEKATLSYTVMLATKLSNATSTEKRKEKKETTVSLYHLTKKKKIKNGNYLNMTKLFERKLKRTTKRLNPCR